MPPPPTEEFPLPERHSFPGRTRLLFLAVVWSVFLVPARPLATVQDDVSISVPAVTALLEEHCFECHDEDNADNHDTSNMPMLLVGGGFKHGQHLALDRDSNYPLPNLFVSMLQCLGIETDSFASSTGTVRGLEFAV